MVQSVLETSLGTKEFHVSTLCVLGSIGQKVQEGPPSVVEKLKKAKSWGTVKNYLCAFSHFVDFMESRKPPLLSKSDVDCLTLKS